MRLLTRGISIILCRVSCVVESTTSHDSRGSPMRSGGVGGRSFPFAPKSFRIPVFSLFPGERDRVLGRCGDKAPLNERVRLLAHALGILEIDVGLMGDEGTDGDEHPLLILICFFPKNLSLRNLGGSMISVTSSSASSASCASSSQFEGRAEPQWEQRRRCDVGEDGGVGEDDACDRVM